MFLDRMRIVVRVRQSKAANDYGFDSPGGTQVGCADGELELRATSRRGRENGPSETRSRDERSDLHMRRAGRFAERWLARSVASVD